MRRRRTRGSSGVGASARALTPLARASILARRGNFGLDADRAYRVRDEDEIGEGIVLTGRALMSEGLPIELPDRFSAAVLVVSGER